MYFIKQNPQETVEILNEQIHKVSPLGKVILEGDNIALQYDGQKICMLKRTDDTREYFYEFVWESADIPSWLVFEQTMNKYLGREAGMIDAFDGFTDAVKALSKASSYELSLESNKYMKDGGK